MNKDLPLDNIRVLDFGHVWAGPMLGGLLADMGAEVIKIESRTRLDLWRMRPGIWWKDVQAEKAELCPGFHNMNRNKMSITLNLRDERAVGLLKQLVKVSDILNENMTAGTMEKMGLGYEAVSEIKGDIIYISSSAFGQSGSLSGLPGYGPTMHALSGFDHTLGYCGERPLGLFAIPFGDPNAALHGVLAVLAALYYRKQTGQGFYVDCSQVESLMCLIGEKMISAYRGTEILPEGNYHPKMAPHNFYPCKGNDEWISIAVKSDDEWRDFCTALDKPEWIGDYRFDTAAKRVQNYQILDELISNLTVQHTADKVTEILRQRGIAVAPSVNPENFDSHPFYKKRSFVETVHPIVGRELLFGSPWKLSRFQDETRISPPLLGEHNDYVFGQMLGLSRNEIDHLKGERVIY